MFKIISFVLCIIISCNCFASFQDENNTNFPSDLYPRRLNVPVNLTQYEQFKNLKCNIDPLAILRKKEKLHLYKVYKEGGTAPGIKLLGTMHDIPLDTLPDAFFKHFEEAEYVYVESESLFHLSLLEKSISNFNIAVNPEALKIYEDSYLKACFPFLIQN